jgi:phage-related protein
MWYGQHLLSDCCILLSLQVHEIAQLKILISSISVKISSSTNYNSFIMASFSQAISDAFSAIFQFFASIFQTIISTLQSLVSLFNTVIKDIVNFSVQLIEFLFSKLTLCAGQQTS